MSHQPDNETQPAQEDKVEKQGSACVMLIQI
jgi:hypothetical protein